MITHQDLRYLERCIELAEEALNGGNAPFGSILVSEDGRVLAEDYNRIAGGDDTQHPEFALARWAAAHMSREERARAMVYTSGEHCAMCAAAHGWVGLGRIVYASSSAQLEQWLAEWNDEPSRVHTLSIEQVIRDTPVDGPVPELAEQVYLLHRQMHTQQKKQS
ncbi:nucleoside deaminase [Paenibacillus sp. Z6-24]